MGGQFVVALCAWLLFASAVHAQHVTIYQRGPAVPEQERFAATVAGAIDCGSPTFIIRNRTEIDPAVGTVVGPGEWHVLGLVHRAALSRCDTPPLLIRHITRRSVSGFLPLVLRYETAARRAFDEAVVSRGVYTSDNPGGHRGFPDTFDGVAMNAQQVRAIMAARATLMRAPQTDKRAWRQALNAYTASLGQVREILAITCDTGAFAQGSYEDFKAVMAISYECENAISAYDISEQPDTVTDAGLRRDWDRAVGPYATLVYGPRRWLAARADGFLTELEAAVDDPALNLARKAEGVRDDLKRLKPAAPTLYAALDQRIAQRIATMEAAERSKYAAERAAEAQREQERVTAAADARARAQAERVARLRGLRGGAGPSGLEIVEAIRTEHFRHPGYAPAGPLGVKEGSPLFPTLALAAREYDVANLSCRPAAGGAFSCSYDLTRRWTTDQFDQSGMFAGLEALANAFGGSLTGRNLANQTHQRTDIFTRTGAGWRSPTWATGIAEYIEEQRRRSQSCTLTQQRTGTRMIVSGNRILGAMPEYGLVKSC
jgi:hypothetical protein